MGAPKKQPGDIALDGFVLGPSHMARLIAKVDWSATSLGPVSCWPPSLRTSINIVLDSPVPIVMLWGPDGIMIYNDAYSEFAGARHPQLLGSKVLEGWPEVADFNAHVMEQGLAGNTLSYNDQELTLYRNNVAEQVWMNLNYSPIRDESGRPAGVMAVVLETTGRILAERKQKEVETALAAERGRLEDLFMHAPAAIAILSGPELVFTLANAPYSQLVGAGRDLVGKRLAEALPELEPGLLKIINDVAFKGKRFVANELAVVLDWDDTGQPYPKYLNFNYEPMYDNGQPNGLMAFVYDVTEQAASRQKIEESEARFRTIANTLPLVLWTAGPDGGLTFISQQWEDIYGNPVADSLGTGWAAFVHPDDVGDAGARWTHSLQTGEDYETEFRVRHKGGDYRWVLVRAVPIRDDDGQITNWYGSNTDLHDKRASEEKIRALNRDLEARVAERTLALTAANKELERSNVELQDFAYVASHDLQEPLRKITAFAGLLESDYQDALPADAKQYLQGLQRSSSRMRTLITDLLAYSRVTTNTQPFKTVSLNDAVDEVRDDLQTQINETGAMIKVGKLGTVEGDALQLRLLLQNLISNAIKYKKSDVPPIITIKSKQTSDACTLTVQDNGIGFNESYSNKIFTIFQRLHGRDTYEGTGIGLAVCKKIVDRHGGSVTAKSTEGVGSTFIVTIPKKQ